MKMEKRDNYKRFIIKYFILAMIVLFTIVGIVKQIIYGIGPGHGRFAGSPASVHDQGLTGVK